MALSDEDRRGRDLVVGWMKDLNLDVSIDRIGNVIGIRAGTEPGNPVLTGSHIDTVATGGRYDGNLGVLAGLEVIETLNDAKLTTRKPLAVGFFTNEDIICMEKCNHKWFVNNTFSNIEYFTIN